MVALAAGIGLATSSLIVFVRDVGHIVAMIVQFGFWLTPIFWSVNSIPERYRFVVKLNPMYHIVQGYRDSLLNNVWFWEKPLETTYLVIVSCVMFSLGYFIFRRLRPHLADLL